MQSQPLNYIEVYTSIPVFYRCYIQVWVVYLTQCPLFHFPLVGSKERSRKAKCNVRELRKKEEWTERKMWKAVSPHFPSLSLISVNWHFPLPQFSPFCLFSVYVVEFVWKKYGFFFFLPSQLRGEVFMLWSLGLCWWDMFLEDFYNS